jgi:hypothetical protein
MSDKTDSPRVQRTISNPPGLDLILSIGVVGNCVRLIRCLESIFNDPDPDITFAVIIVANGCQTDALSALQQQFRSIRVIRYEHALGWTRTHNQVLRTANSRYVLILDDDTLVHPGTLHGMVDFMDHYPMVGVAGCRTVNPDGSFQQICGVDHSLRSELLYALKLSSFWPKRLCREAKAWQEVDWLNGSFLLARSAAIRQVGLLDDFYYTFLSEPDWCYRFRLAGWKVAYVPEYSIIHVGREHSIMSRVKSYKNLIRWHVNRYYFFRKHYGQGTMNLLRPIMVIGALVRLGFFSIVFLANPRRRSEAGPKVRAYLRVIGLSLSPTPYRLPQELFQDSDLGSAAS